MSLRNATPTTGGHSAPPPTLLSAKKGGDATGAMLVSKRRPFVGEHYVRAVVKLSMGENMNSCIVMEDDPQDARVYLDIEPPRILACNVGPFKYADNVIFSKSEPRYLWTTLPCVMSYLERSVVFGVDGEVCFAHGGISHLDMNGGIGNQLQNEFFPGIDVTKTTLLSEMADKDTSASARNRIHMLGFNTGKSFITGRMYVWEACLRDDAAAKKHVHPYLKMLVCGHTPQWSGLPMIIFADGKHAAVLDTQYTDRVLNTHALVTSDDGRFKLRGSWSGVFDYVADSEDAFIGTLIDSVGGFNDDDPMSAFRIVCKKATPLTTDGSVEYVAVRYIADPGPNPEALGRTQMLTFVLTSDHNTGITTQFPSGTKIKDKDIVPPNIFVRLNGAKKPTAGIMAPFPSKGVAWCGDIEASVDFLCGFLRHASKMLGVDLSEFATIARYRNVMMGGEQFERYGFNSSYFRDVAVEVYLRSHTLLASGIRIGCIGDVVGDPIGNGNAHASPMQAAPTVKKTTLVDEFVCMHWAAHMTTDGFRAVGNRDINKLRFIDEISFLVRNYIPNAERLRVLKEFVDDPTSKDKTAAAKLALAPLVFPVDASTREVMHFGHGKADGDSAPAIWDGAR